MQKTFVLDTNVLLHNPNALESFEDNNVVLPMAVIEELDHFKKGTDEINRNARRIIRHLDDLRQRGNLGEGVDTDRGGTIRILTARDLPDDMILVNKIPDNRILRVAYHLHSKGEPIIFVSKDINCRIKADALGIAAEDYETQKVNVDELYTGCTELSVSTAIVNSFYEQESVILEGHSFYPNQFVLLKDETNEKHTALGKIDEHGHIVHLVTAFDRAWNIKGRSKEQRMALELLMDDRIKIVTLVGQAGTGKTLLALAAAMEATINSKLYDQVLVTRPIIPFGQDIGYLPGTKDEKLEHWMQPIFDNLTYLMGHVNPYDDGKAIRKKIEDLRTDHVIALEALTYIRGRSIPNQYIIVDEAQNLTPHEVKTIVSRAGEGTKMVLTGDPYQIDNPYLDASSNGLTYAAERLKGQQVHGHITLRKSERSALAGIAADLL